MIILNKNNISIMKVILSDLSKFQKLSIDQNKVLNHIVHMENRIIDVVKKLQKKRFEDLYPVGSSLGILYGRAKIHKLIKDGVPSFCPILYKLCTYTYIHLHIVAPWCSGYHCCTTLFN